MNPRSLFWGTCLAFFGGVVFAKYFGTDHPWVVGLSALAFVLGVQALVFQIARWTSSIGIILSAWAVENIDTSMTMETLRKKLTEKERNV